MYREYYKYDEQRGFWVPLLLGGLGGAAIASASRPRPVYVTPPTMPYYPYQNFGYNYPYYR